MPQLFQHRLRASRGTVLQSKMLPPSVMCWHHKPCELQSLSRVRRLWRGAQRPCLNMQSTGAGLRRQTVKRVPEALVPRLTPTNKTDEKRGFDRFQGTASQADHPSRQPQLALAPGARSFSNALGRGDLRSVRYDRLALRRPAGVATKGPLVSRARKS